MKTIEVEEGTEFVLCTDGITRHISDNELRQLLVLHDNLDDVCAQLKERCFERGAEDNLTVVLVRVGNRISTGDRIEELEPTITPDTQPILALRPDGIQQTATSESTLIPPSRVAFPGPSAEASVTNAQEKLNVADPTTQKSGGGAARFFLFLFVLVLIAAAFYAGARYRDRIPYLASLATQAKPIPTPESSPKPVEEPFVQFERSRREVDRDPRAWLASEPTKEFVNSRVQTALESPNPEFLYLYGRANLLTGNTDEAAKAFEGAITKAEGNTSPTIATIKKEATLGLAAVSLKTAKDREKALLHYDELTKPPTNPTAP